MLLKGVSCRGISPLSSCKAYELYLLLLGKSYSVQHNKKFHLFKIKFHEIIKFDIYEIIVTFRCCNPLILVKTQKYSQHTPCRTSEDIEFYFSFIEYSKTHIIHYQSNKFGCLGFFSCFFFLVVYL